MGYNRRMSRGMRMANAALLALAVAILPVVLDHCSASCEAHRDAVASSPSCHHATAAGTRLGSVPAPCGHDHSGTVATAAGNAPSLDRSLVSVAVAATPAIPIVPPASDRRFLAHASPGSPHALVSRSLPLRV